jgi:hypothetical protein
MLGKLSQMATPSRMSLLPIFVRVRAIRYLHKICLITAPGFWDLGHELFKSTPESFPAVFIAGDVFDSSLLAPRPPFCESPQTPPPPLTCLTSLTPLQGHISAIHASSLFHLFGEEKQLELAHAIATLLSPLPGSVIFGSHLGHPVKGFRTEMATSRGNGIFCHSPDSWCELWNGKVFERGTVRVDAGLKQLNATHSKFSVFSMLWWSVTRL